MSDIYNVSAGAVWTSTNGQEREVRVRVRVRVRGASAKCVWGGGGVLVGAVVEGFTGLLQLFPTRATTLLLDISG